MLLSASILAFTSCDKAEFESEIQDEQLLKSGSKVLNFRTHLSGQNEVPANASEATGQAIFQLSKDGMELSYKLIVDDISNVTMAHIHLAPVGVNGKPVAWLYQSSPNGPVEGILAEGVITKENLINDLAGQELSSLIDAIFEGNTYVNVHTTSFPGGEIRGQIEGNMPVGEN